MTPPARRPKVVALGGGHGLHAMLSAFTLLDVDITAVVTVADDGGSSGRLRREMPGQLPPGDLRMALAALTPTDTDHRLWRDTFQHRFSGHGALAGHSVGNLVLAGLSEVLGDPVAALDAAARMLGSRGRVLPMSTRPLVIVAQVEGLESDPEVVRTIRGQVAVASTPGLVRSVALEPGDAPACPEAIAAIEEADLVTLGPGSWFTSVVPHVMLPDIARALRETTAHRLVVLNLEPQAGETEGFSPEQLLDVLSSHAPRLIFDTVLADTAAVPVPGRLATATEAAGSRLLMAPIAVPGRPVHDPRALAGVVQQVLEGR